MILALIRSADEEFDLVWSLAEQLPFSWYLVPVAGGCRLQNAILAPCGRDWATTSTDGTMLWGLFREFRQRVTVVSPSSSRCAIGSARGFSHDRPVDNSVLAMARYQASMLRQSSYREEGTQALMARHHAEEWYPDGPRVMEQTLGDLIFLRNFVTLIWPTRFAQCAVPPSLPPRSACTPRKPPKISCLNSASCVISIPSGLIMLLPSRSALVLPDVPWQQKEHIHERSLPNRFLLPWPNSSIGGQHALPWDC